MNMKNLKKKTEENRRRKEKKGVGKDKRSGMNKIGINIK